MEAAILAYLLGVSQNIVAGWLIYLWHFKKHIKPALQRLEHHAEGTGEQAQEGSQAEASE